MSKSKLLIRGGLAVGKGVARVADVLIEDGIIAAIGDEIAVDDTTEIFDANGAIVTYGLADVHVHLREPGYSEKETIASGTAAAAFFSKNILHKGRCIGTS